MAAETVMGWAGRRRKDGIGVYIFIRDFAKIIVNNNVIKNTI